MLTLAGNHAATTGGVSLHHKRLLGLHGCCCCCCIYSAEESGTVYVREDYKKQLLLMHVLVVALDVEGWSLAPAQFDALRKELKMTAADVVAR
jgi:hypothetical protein